MRIIHFTASDELNKTQMSHAKAKSQTCKDTSLNFQQRNIPKTVRQRQGQRPP